MYRMYVANSVDCFNRKTTIIFFKLLPLHETKVSVKMGRKCNYESVHVLITRLLASHRARYSTDSKRVAII